MVRWCWVNFQCRGVLLIWIIVWQGLTALAVGAGGGCLDIFSLVYHFSLLSPTLWETARYRLKYCLKGPLSPKQPTNHLYVDDFLICYRSKNMNTIERQLQLNLNKIQNWAIENGFKFSKSKTVCMHFCHLRKAHNNPVLALDGTLIPVVEEKKFLGVIFDRKLVYSSHQATKS